MAESSNPGCVSIGEGVKLTGRLDLPGVAKIDGEIDGEVLANEVRVGATGRITGSVTTALADVYGEIQKDITVTDTMILRSTARVRGSVVYEIIEIEQGATIEGDLKRGAADKRVKSAIPEAPAPQSEPLPGDAAANRNGPAALEP
jgi:cytoskeletal protein CcmA (bactofilin family)